MHGSYWKSVLVAFLLGLTSASFASSGSAANAEGISDGYYSFEHYLPVILTFVFFAGVLALALRIFLLRPLEVGCRRYFLEDIIRPAELDCLKAGFSGNYRNVVWVMFCRDIFIFLWTLLLIVPGIVKSYEYRMVPYVLAENPDLSREEAFALSKRMMDGDKMNAFILDLSFIGWAILTILTCGLVGIFYYQPYLALTDAALYQTLKKKVDRFFDDGGYTGGYNDGGYTGGGYADGSNNNGGYNNGSYNGGGYGDSGYGDSGYGDGGYGDGGYNNGGYGDSGNSYGGYNNDGYGDSGNSYGGYNNGGYGDGGNNNGGYGDSGKMAVTETAATVMAATIMAVTETAATITAATITAVTRVAATETAATITVPIRAATTAQETITAIIIRAALKTAIIQPTVHGKKTRIPGLKTEEKTIRGKMIHKERRLLRRIGIV